MERQYTPEEAAAFLRLSRRELYRKLARGDLAHAVVPGGRRILIAQSDLLAYLAAGRVEAFGAPE
jgi:excisionase family DNA binding protein